MLAKIGSVVFQARDIPFSRLQLEKKLNWIEHKTLKGLPILSFMGKSARRIEIVGTLLTDFHKGLQGLEELHKLADSGEPVPFSAVSGTKASYLGLWAIISINEERSIFDSKGHAKKIDFRLDLLELASARNQNPTR